MRHTILTLKTQPGILFDSRLDLLAIIAFQMGKGQMKIFYDVIDYVFGIGIFIFLVFSINFDRKYNVKEFCMFISLIFFDWLFLLNLIDFNDVTKMWLYMIIVFEGIAGVMLLSKIHKRLLFKTRDFVAIDQNQILRKKKGNNLFLNFLLLLPLILSFMIVAPLFNNFVPANVFAQTGIDGLDSAHPANVNWGLFYLKWVGIFGIVLITFIITMKFSNDGGTVQIRFLEKKPDEKYRKETNFKALSDKKVHKFFTLNDFILIRITKESAETTNFIIREIEKLAPERGLLK